MNSETTYYFELLKKKVASTFLKDHAAPKTIEEWKGEEIVLFQEDLFTKVKAKVSEKWFYTYFKKQATKLPRIDMLNLLCEYVGLSNWNTFKNEHKSLVESKVKINKNKYLLLVLAPVAVLAWFLLKSSNEFHFCFVDELQNKPIEVALDVKIISNEESPIILKTDSLGCFTYKTASEYITFVVKSPYHKTDTIVRHINSNTNQKVHLTTDDYALMLRFYTDGNIKDWKKHKNKLQHLVADEAVIYQFYSNNIGIELFDKDDFIRLLTIPTDNLQRIKILERTFENGKIIRLKFILL